ncbi:MAG TPA: UDP-N-acetylmuramoyl-L-alanine--D-glutamate ligase [Candidatus Absconditabacterales bacterium]|nr:UDP-N-acetylmuramoyl-L-alanine--D-glutamate ligase [Candidatus Absconditabacterales bacterium]
MIVIFGKGKVGKGLEKLLKKLNIKYVIMDDQDFDSKILDESTKIICSPGIKKNHKIYKKYGDKILSELNFLGDVIKDNDLDNKIEFVGVTGTNGKSTSVHIMYHMFVGLFEKLGKDYKVHISGNFGTPLSQTILEILEDGDNTNHLVILEVSSFMLNKLNNFAFDYSILTNLGVDHLDWHNDIQDYFDCKFKIIDYTKTYAITSSEVLQKYEERIGNGDNKIFENTVIETYENDFDIKKTNFLGKHNEWNWNAIYKLINRYFENKDWDLREKVFWDVAKDIEPLEHRMKMVKNIDGIKIYDDGICTSSQALNAALSCFDDEIVLIAGGYDKGEEYDWLAEYMSKKIYFACLIGQTAKKFEKICKEKNIGYKIFDSLQDAVHYSVKIAKEMGIKNILFSPGSASFDMFENVYDRCDKFSSIIDKL